MCTHPPWAELQSLTFTFWFIEICIPIMDPFCPFRRCDIYSQMQIVTTDELMCLLKCIAHANEGIAT